MHVVSLLPVIPSGECAVLSSSSLESCVRGSSSQQEEDLECDKKLVLTVSVGGAQTLATEELQLDLRCIGRSVPFCLPSDSHAILF